MICTPNIQALPSLPMSDRSQLPACPAIYFVIAGTGELLYIGRTKSLVTRWKDHHRFGLHRTVPGVRVAWMALQESEHLLPQIEKELIDHFAPKLNGIHIRLPLKPARLPSVRLSKADLERLLKAAELAGARPSEFIRKALTKEVDRLARRHPELQAA